MTAALRLLRIEVLRSAALWSMLPLAALVAWGTTATMHPDGAPTLWSRSCIQLGMLCVVAAFIMSGVGAWAAGRDRRRQMVDLLVTMPSPLALRDLTLWAGTAVWGLIGCLLTGAYVFAVAQREATWGGPAPSPLVIGLCSVLASTAVGYLGGVLVPGRFAASLAAVGFAAAVLLVGTRSSAIAYLSPLAMDPRGSEPYDVFYRAPTLPLAPVCLWLAGVTASALALAVLWRRRTLPVLGVLACALCVATSGAIATMQDFEHPPWERIYPGQPLVAYQPACIERAIPICVHPAYAATLKTDGERIAQVVEPLAGIPGGPVRAEQLPSPERHGLRADGTLAIVPGAFVVPRAAYVLVHAGVSQSLTPAQLAIALWLMDRTGASASETQWMLVVAQAGTTVVDEPIDAALARFAALAPDAQRAWLCAHFQELRAGQIELDDLP